MNARQRRKARRKTERANLIAKLGEASKGLTLSEIRALANG